MRARNWDRVRQPHVVVELVLLGVAAAATWALIPYCGTLYEARAHELGLHGDSGANRAALFFTLGVAAIALGRLIGIGRAHEPIRAPLLLPSMVFAALIGLALHTSTLETRYALIDGTRVARLVAPSATRFAEGFALGGLAAGIIAALPVDLGALLLRLKVPAIVFVVLVFVALAVAGSGPVGSGARINLGPLQPIELVKPAFVVFVAALLGERAGKLRWQRRKFALLRWPRPKLLFPAILFLLCILAGLFVVGDLGPILVLAFVFLGMSYAVTRASGWVLIALGLCAAFAATLVVFPELVGGNLFVRIRMWTDPWQNGLARGHQLGESLWGFSAGGWWGQGLGQASLPLVPAAKTDLALSILTEQIGFIGLTLYLGLLGVFAVSGFRVAIASRTPGRMLLAGGLSMLVIVQWAIIHAGSLGLLPLTGIVAPFLSAGRSSMIAFVVIGAVLARMAVDGRPRTSTEDLQEVGQGMWLSSRAAIAVLLVGAAAAGHRAVVVAESTSASGIVQKLADGTVVHRHNPRLLAITAAIRRGAIVDRNGKPFAHNPDPSDPQRREYPLGSALGTLLGVHPSRVLRPPWALERRFDTRLRGFAERRDGPRYADFGKPKATGRLPSPDLRPFAAMLRMSRAERRAKLAQIDAAIANRSVTLSLDARLQKQVATILRKRLEISKGLGASAVVLDVHTGQVLARVQVPDLDPADPSWQQRILKATAKGRARFFGTYGRWPDRSHTHGIFQAGSIAKIVTGLVAARKGWKVTGSGCEVSVPITYDCKQRDNQGPLYTRAGWIKPIHDHHKDSRHGTIGFVRALAVSCNVYFAQLGLGLGPAGFASLVGEGLGVGFQGSSSPGFKPGPKGSRALASTAFGQGAMAMSVLQAARMVAAVGAGGVYRRCPNTMELKAACQEHTLIDDPEALRPVLAGMRAVMTSGTGRRLRPPARIRVYGKTGTADAVGFRGEQAIGIELGETARPHSWFVALAEPETAPACKSSSSGRLAVAVVINRGGAGAAAAGPAAMQILAACKKLGYLGSGEPAPRSPP